MTAEKIPGLAVGSTTPTSVCQGVAPSAIEPKESCLGTEKMASSAIEKMVGITATPIAMPTTSALRCEYLMPSVVSIQACILPPKAAASMGFATAKQNQTTTATTGISSAPSYPAGTVRWMRAGRLSQR